MLLVWSARSGLVVESVSKLAGFEFAPLRLSNQEENCFRSNEAFISRKKPAVAFGTDDLLNFYELFVGKPVVRLTCTLKAVVHLPF